MTPMPLAARLAALALPAALGLLVACSSADPGPTTPPPTSGNEKRDTEIKHESCDGNSSAAVRIDANGDGKPDIIHVMNGPRELCRIVDLNLDGSMDAFIYYEGDGVTERRRESDFDRDGRADEIALYSQGVVVLKMRETNFDNKIDTWDYYEGGRLAKRERDSDGDGAIDQWWTFNNPQNPKCAIVAADRNGDGKPDPESVVDLCGDAYGVNRGAPGLAPGASAAPSAGAPGLPAAAAPGLSLSSAPPLAPPGAPPAATQPAPQPMLGGSAAPPPSVPTALLPKGAPAQPKK